MGFARRIVVIGALAITIAAFTGLTASAQTVCEPYAGGCTDPSRPNIPTVSLQPTGGGSSTAIDRTGSLPVTGADIAGLIVLATILVGGGATLVAVSKRRRAATPDAAV